MTEERFEKLVDSVQRLANAVETITAEIKDLGHRVSVIEENWGSWVEHLQELRDRGKR